MLKDIFLQYDKLQDQYGDKKLNAIYGGGCTNEPDLCLVFVNPTARNKTCNKSWGGIRYPWLTTKQIWSFLSKCGLFDEQLNNIIQSKKPQDWDEEFCERVYDEVKDKKLYITNLAKCTQIDARPLPDEIFNNYVDLLKQEIGVIKPKKVILFGNQVASVVLGRKIAVSTCRKQQFDLVVEGKKLAAYAVFYPVGNGRFNIDKAIEDLNFVAKC